MPVEVYEMSGYRGGVRAMPILAKHSLTIGSTSGADISAAFNRGASVITVLSTAACRIVVGSSPTSTGAHFYVPPSTPIDFAIVAGQKIIALSSTTT